MTGVLLKAGGSSIDRGVRFNEPANEDVKALVDFNMRYGV
jgi:hypothetical protein